MILMRPNEHPRDYLARRLQAKAYERLRRDIPLSALGTRLQQVAALRGKSADEIMDMFGAKRA